MIIIDQKSNDIVKMLPRYQVKNIKRRRKKTAYEYKMQLQEKNIQIECIEEYKGDKTSILHKCLLCCEFFSCSPNYILKGGIGHKCKFMKRTRKINKSNKNTKYTNEQFLEKLFSIRNDVLPLEEYKGSQVKILCKCLICDTIWKITPHNLFLMHHCKKCANRNRGEFQTITTDEYKKRFANKTNKIIPLGEYIDSRSNMLFYCLVCNNQWESRAGQMLCKPVCPFCNMSNGEQKIAKYLDNHGIKYTYEKKYSDLKNYRLLSYDFYIIDYHFLIEYNGIQHYAPIEFMGGQEKYEQRKVNDELKFEYAKKNNIPLLVIRYDEDIENKLYNYFLNNYNLNLESVEIVIPA